MLFSVQRTVSTIKFYLSDLVYVGKNTVSLKTFIIFLRNKDVSWRKKLVLDAILEKFNIG